MATLYVLVFRASRRAQEDFPRFVSRNFAYLKNLSLLSDLLVKVAALAVVIHLGQPRWLAPLLVLFVGDFLLQGRFFALPLRPSLGVGLLCVGGAGALAVWGDEVLSASTMLNVPLAVFVAVSAMSLWHLVRRRRAARAPA